MADLAMIEREIRELEASETCYRTCERLAWLYICRDHMRHAPVEEVVTEPEGESSEFVAAARAADLDGLMRVLDEHMEALRVVQPREYSAVLGKIRALGGDSNGSEKG